MFNSNKQAAKIETVLGANTEFEGNIRTSECLRIDGKVKGMVSASAVILGEGGVVLGDMSAERVTVAGKIKGNVTATSSLEILAKGQIFGDIRTNKLVISDGATFEGNCQMLKTEGQVIELQPEDSDGRENHHNKNLKLANHKG